MLLAATTPLFFAALWLLALNGRLDEAVALRPVVASVVALWFKVGTTPYPDLFAPIRACCRAYRRRQPVLTHRAVFVLLQRLERLWRALFRGGARRSKLRRRGERMAKRSARSCAARLERSQRLPPTCKLAGIPAASLVVAVITGATCAPRTSGRRRVRRGRGVAHPVEGGGPSMSEPIVHVVRAAHLS